MSTRKKRKRWNIQEHSGYKMVVYFKNKAGKGPNGKDKASYFYSFDWKSSYSRDFMPNKGLGWFHKKIAEWGDLANFILIYDRTTDVMIEKYFEGEPFKI
ncbi:hypothetical protein [uncultured Aquimarina sp.]|uniref:hypothetical protein n=1 Tax=uncultured Aquimarina sp. TaxID=575652 RepID=UPI0026019E55|nr:hypothetical protein [uncultured Aquimarina sp.]